MRLQEILSRLQNVKKSGNGYSARCPSHNDGQNSLVVKAGTHKTFLDCYAQKCSESDICAALGIEPKDLRFEPYQTKQPAVKNGYKSEAAQTQTANNQEKKVIGKETVCTYEYADENGEVLYLVDRVHRTFDDGATDKIFPQYRIGANGERVNSLNGTRRVPYRLPELVEAVKNDADIFFCEGEKDADNVRALGLSASSFKNWKPEFNQYITGARLPFD